jgi:hypothetical protein
VLLVAACSAIGLCLVHNDGLPSDALAGASGRCVGVRDRRELPRTGWMQPGQADFDFTVAADGRSMVAVTADDLVGESPSRRVTWKVTDSDGDRVTVRGTADGDPDHRTDLAIAYRRAGDRLVLTVTRDGEPEVFDVDLRAVENGRFRVVGRQGGIMSCQADIPS